MEKIPESELRAALILATGGRRFSLRGDQTGFTLSHGMLFVWPENEEAVRSVLAAYNIPVVKQFHWASGVLEFTLNMVERVDFGR